MSYYRNSYRKTAPKPVLNPKGLRARLTAVKNLPSLTAWESEFMTSITEFYGKRTGLTEGQIVAFEKIEKKYDAKTLNKFREFEKNFGKEQRKKFNLACDYYSRTPEGYYGQIVRLWRENKDDPSWVPALISYEKVVNNKYFQRIWEEVQKPRKFSNGSMVKMRANGKYFNAEASAIVSTGRFGFLMPHRWHVVGKSLLILAGYETAVVSAVRGCRIVKVHCLNDGQTYYTEERFVKKVKTA